MSDGQSASLSWCQATIGAFDQFFFFLEIFFRQLRVCYFVAPSLVIYCCCWALPVQSLGTQDHILLPQFLRPPQPGGPDPHIYISQVQGGPSYTPGHWVPFLLPRTTRRDYGGGIQTHLHMLNLLAKAKLLYIALVYSLRVEPAEKKHCYQRLLMSVTMPYPRKASQSFITTDSQSASPSWCQAPIWDP
jgi:hypothetical protein